MTVELKNILFPAKSGTRVWVLLDPDSLTIEKITQNVKSAEQGGASAFLIGGSFISDEQFDNCVIAVKAVTNLPIILFPGSSRQLSRHADGILFTSLLSGRNPQYLIGEQVMAAPRVMAMKLPVMPTAYLLIESGRVTSAQFVSNTSPIPRDKPSLAVAHAQAAQLFGMQAVYLEAGSGALNQVPAGLIKHVVGNISIPVIVGGGIRSIESAEAAAKAGAKAIVIGTAVENDGGRVIGRIVSAISNLV
jgi:phosphoglycerol geranylgeranyltransferase